MLVVITKIICDECNGADISTSSYIEQKEMVILAARESGWKTRETRRRKHPQWICPNCVGEVGKMIIMDDVNEPTGPDAEKKLLEWYEKSIGADEEESE